MYYFDTSFLIPLFLPEETSDQLEDFFHRLPADANLMVSHWTRVEFVSVLSRLVRMGEMGSDTAIFCAERFSRLLDENLQVVMPRSTDFNLCWKYLAGFNNSLRAGDALHLAIASNLMVEKIFTLDNGMLKNGRMLGLPVDRGIL